VGLRGHDGDGGGSSSDEDVRADGRTGKREGRKEKS